MANTTNYSWETPDDTDLVKDGAAAIRTLGSSIDTTTKALNPSTTLGDIEYRSSTANTNTRLGVGSTGQVLTVAGGVPSWATPAAGGGMTLLSTTSMSGAASYELSSINQTYKRLMLVAIGLNRGSTSSTRFYPQDGSTDLSLGYTWYSGGNTTNTDSTYAVWPDDNNGYIGTILGQELIKAGHEITGLDTDYYSEAWMYEIPGFTAPNVIKKDIRDVKIEDLEEYRNQYYLQNIRYSCYFQN
jgi:hypothetical protein